jgi:hypothetical protein
MVYSTDKQKGKKFWKAKVFDCQDMPEKVMRRFFEQNTGDNGSFVSLLVYDEHKPKNEIKDPKNVLFSNMYGYVIERGDDIVADWLFENGTKRGERVLVNRWW